MHKIVTMTIALSIAYMSDCPAQTLQKRNQIVKQTEKVMENLNEEQKKVLSTIERMTKSFESKDIEGVLATYEANAIVMFEPQIPLSGKENLRNAFTQFASMNPRFTYLAHEVYISGDIASHLAPWTMVGNLPDGNQVEQSGLSISVLRKQTDDRWLIIQDNPNGQYLLSK